MPRPPNPEKLRKVTIRVREEDYFLLSRVRDMNSAIREAVKLYCTKLLKDIQTALDGHRKGDDPVLDEYQEILDEMGKKKARKEFKSIYYR